MAFTKSKKSGGLAVRRASPMVSKKKFEAIVARTSGAKKKAREVAERRMGALAGVAACGAVGYLEKVGKMPRMAGFEPTAVIGLALGFVAPEFIKGKAGAMVAEAGAAVAGVAAYKLANGQPLRVAGDDDDDY